MTYDIICHDILCHDVICHDVIYHDVTCNNVICHDVISQDFICHGVTCHEIILQEVLCHYTMCHMWWRHISWRPMPWHHTKNYRLLFCLFLDFWNILKTGSVHFSTAQSLQNPKIIFILGLKLEKLLTKMLWEYYIWNDEYWGFNQFDDELLFFIFSASKTT